MNKAQIGRLVILGGGLFAVLLAGTAIVLSFVTKTPPRQLDPSETISLSRNTPTPQVSLPEAPQGYLNVEIRSGEIENAPWESLADMDNWPIQPGSRLRLTLHMDRPLYAYFFVIDAKGQIWPLAPWSGEPEIRDYNMAIVPRWEIRPVWKIPTNFDEGYFLNFPPGITTIIALATPEPLPASFDTVEMIGPPPMSKKKAYERERTSILYDRASPSPAYAYNRQRGETEEEIENADVALFAFLKRFRDRFEVVRAVQFLNSPAPSPPPP